MPPKLGDSRLNINWIVRLYGRPHTHFTHFCAVHDCILPPTESTQWRHVLFWLFLCLSGVQSSTQPSRSQGRKRGELALWRASGRKRSAPKPQAWRIKSCNVSGKTKVLKKDKRLKVSWTKERVGVGENELEELDWGNTSNWCVAWKADDNDKRWWCSWKWRMTLPWL